MIKKNSNKISGWIILDKKAGITSRQAVSKISKIFNLKFEAGKSIVFKNLICPFLILVNISPIGSVNVIFLLPT